MRLGMDGDDTAYRRLLEALARSLRASVRHRLSRSGMGNADIEDVVQETLLAIHLKRHTWDRSGLLGPWLAAIARHKLIDLMRRRGRRGAVPLEDVEWMLSGEEADEGATRDVGQILNGLGTRQRDIVQLVSIEGRSIREAAQHLRMTEVAVRVALHRTLKALAKIYRRDPNE
jgi:RNA polymerase sigma-70 factor (ECF subfamily)